MIKILTLVAVFALALPQALFAQDPAPAQKPPGPIVELNLIVTDKDRNPVDKIGKDEIQIIEDKVQQTVLTLERDDRPISYGLVIDNSGSLRSLLSSAIEAAKMIVINRRGSDEIFIERFVSSDKIQKLQDFTTDNSALLLSLTQMRIEAGQSAVIDALYTAAEYIAQHNSTGENRLKAIVIITDGEDRNSVQNVKALVSLLRKNNIQVYALGLIIELGRESGLVRMSPREKAERLLNTITEETGGSVFYPKSGPELIKATAGIITDLRSRFRVTYQSSQPEKKGSRKIDVKVTSPGGEKRRVVVHQVGPKDDQPKTKEQK